MTESDSNARMESLERTVTDLKNEGRFFSKDTLLHIVIPAFLASLTIGLLTWLDLQGTPLENSKIPSPTNNQEKVIYYPGYVLFSGIVGTAAAMILNSIPVNNGQRKQTTVSSFILGLSVPLSLLTISNTSNEATSAQEDLEDQKEKVTELKNLRELDTFVRQDLSNLAIIQTDPNIVEKPQFNAAIRAYKNLKKVSPVEADKLYPELRSNFNSARSRDLFSLSTSEEISNQLNSLKVDWHDDNNPN